MKTLGNITYSKTSEFQGATFLNDASVAYDILNKHLDPGWYPENADCAWTDIAVVDGRYYAAFGEDAVTVSDAKMIYIEIKPTADMKKEYEYYKQF